MTNTTPPSGGTADALTGWTRRPRIATEQVAPRPLDQYAATDPAVNALDELLNFFGYFAPGRPEIEKATATIRDALTDRIKLDAADVRDIVDWSQHADAVLALNATERALIARLVEHGESTSEAGR